TGNSHGAPFFPGHKLGGVLMTLRETSNAILRLDHEHSALLAGLGQKSLGPAGEGRLKEIVRQRQRLLDGLCGAHPDHPLCRTRGQKGLAPIRARWSAERRYTDNLRRRVSQLRSEAECKRAALAQARQIDALVKELAGLIGGAAP